MLRMYACGTNEPPAMSAIRSLSGVKRKLDFEPAKGTLCGHIEIKQAETRSTAAQLRKSFCHRKGIEPTFREGSPRSCAKMWQSEIESRLGRIGVQHEPSR